MKKKMQINKKKEERRGTQEKMLEPEKSAKVAKASNAEKAIKAARPVNAEKAIKTARPVNAEKAIKTTKPANVAKALKPAKSNKPAERADVVCPYAKKCGGCDYQGMPYEKQLKEKQAYVQKQVVPSQKHSIYFPEITAFYHMVGRFNALLCFAL